MKRESAWGKGAGRLLVLLLSMAVILSFSFVNVAFADETGGVSSDSKVTETQSSAQEGQTDTQKINLLVVKGTSESDTQQSEQPVVKEDPTNTQESEQSAVKEGQTDTQQNNQSAAEVSKSDTQEKDSTQSSQTSATKWDKSKSKTATNLDSNYESLVTLSLPSKEEQLSSDIVFVMDKSSCREQTGKEMESLLDTLKTSLSSSNANVKISLVAFDGVSHTLYPLTEFNGSDEQIQTIKGYAVTNNIPDEEHVSGTNMQAGLLAASPILNGDQSVQNNRKYVVLVSDGLTRLFTKDGGNYESADDVRDIYYKGTSFSPNPEDYWGAMSIWAQARGYDENHNFGLTASSPSWNEYWNNVVSWVEKDKQNRDPYALSFKVLGNGARKDFDKDYAEKDAYIKDNNFKYLTDNGDDVYSEHAMAVDRAIYEAYQAYNSLVSQNYHCYAVTVKNEHGSSAFGGQVISALNNLSGGQNVDFDVIKNDICYLVGPNSYVTDHIGYSKDNYNFDLVDPSTMVITVDDASGNALVYNAVQIAENHFGFNQLEENKYAYVVTYTPGDKNEGEYLTWTINVPITNFQHVSLTYKVKLMNPQTAAGTYGQPDLNGDGIVDGTSDQVDPTKALFTNGITTLTPTDSNGNPGDSESFNSPSVDYSVSTTPVTPIDPVNPVIPDNPVTPVTPTNPTTDDGTTTNPPTNPQTDNNQETIGEEQNTTVSPAENNTGIKTVKTSSQNPKMAAADTAKTSTAPKTADATRVGTMLILFGGAAALLSVLLAVKKRENE